MGYTKKDGIQLTSGINILPETIPTQTVTFNKASGADFSLPANRDLIVANKLEITRGEEGKLFNYVAGTRAVGGSPFTTLWQEATLTNFHTDKFQTFTDLIYENANTLPGRTFVVKYIPFQDEETGVLETKIFELTFTSWESGGVGGAFGYTRTVLTDYSVFVTSGYLVSIFDSLGVEQVEKRKFFSSEGMEVATPSNWNYISTNGGDSDKLFGSNDIVGNYRNISLTSNANFLIAHNNTGLNIQNNSVDLGVGEEGDVFLRAGVSSITRAVLRLYGNATTEFTNPYGLQLKLGTGGTVANPTVGQVLAAKDTDGTLEWVNP